MLERPKSHLISGYRTSCAADICVQDVIRFFFELSSIHWTHESLVFLDEVSFDNRGMLRRRGYAIKVRHFMLVECSSCSHILKGQKLFYRGEFYRMPRISLLCFVDCDGLVETFVTDGTFDRSRFISCCREFALSGNVQQHPGRRSVWILMGLEFIAIPISHTIFDR